MGKRTNKANFTATLVESTATATCTSNAATCNAEAGVITTESLSTAGAATQALAITNSKVTASSIVTATLCDYAGTLGTNGIPVITVDTVGSSSFVINVTNAGSNALSGVLKIAFQVLAPIA